MLPSFSFGAEGVEYGRAASYYATTAGNEVFPDDVDVQGNLTVEGSTTLHGTAVNGTLTVAQGLTGGTRTAYFTNGGSPPAEKSVAIFNDQSSGTLTAWRNNGNEGTLQFDGGVTGGQFVLNRPLVVQANTEGSSGNLNVGGKALVFDGIYGASLTTPPSFPVGFTSGVPLPFPTTTYNTTVIDSSFGAFRTLGGNSIKITMFGSPNPNGTGLYRADVWNGAWSATDLFVVSIINTAMLSGSGLPVTSGVASVDVGPGNVPGSGGALSARVTYAIPPGTSIDTALRPVILLMRFPAVDLGPVF